MDNAATPDSPGKVCNGWTTASENAEFAWCDLRGKDGTKHTGRIIT